MQAVASTAKKSLSKEETDRILEELLDKYGTRVVELAFFYLKDRYAAEDAAQEVFLKAYQNLNNFNWESSPYTWIYRITVNHCKDRLRSRSWHKLIPFSNELLSVLPEKEFSPEDQIITNLSNKELLIKVMALNVIHREVLILHYYQELSVSEVAAVLGTNENTIKSRLLRARKALKDELNKGGEQND